MRILLLTALLATAPLAQTAVAQELPEGYWSLDQANEVLAKTRKVMLDPDLSALTKAEWASVYIVPLAVYSSLPITPVSLDKQHFNPLPCLFMFVVIRLWSQ
jgi:hypothetical protein